MDRGPADADAYLLEVANVFHLADYARLLKDKLFDAMLISEHSIAQRQCADVRRVPEDSKIGISKGGQEKAGIVGGTRMLLKGESNMIEPKLEDPQLAKV